MMNSVPSFESNGNLIYFVKLTNITINLIRLIIPT